MTKQFASFQFMMSKKKPKFCDLSEKPPLAKIKVILKEKIRSVNYLMLHHDEERKNDLAYFIRQRLFNIRQKVKN